MDALDIHAEAMTRWKAAQEHEREDRELAEEDFAFVSGEGQWPSDIKEQRDNDNRPCLQFNRLPVFISHVMGDARKNRPAVKVSPVDSGADVETAEIYAGMIRHIESDSDADIAYLSALQTCCEGGLGHWRILTDYVDDESFDQEIKIERIANPLSVSWDDNAKHHNKIDANWCFVSDWMTREAFDKKYPDESDMRGVANWPEEEIVRRFGAWYDSSTNKVRVAEYFVKEQTKKTLYLLWDGSTTLEKPEDAYIKDARETYETTVKNYVLSGDRVLEGPRQWPCKYIPIVSIYGPEEFTSGRVRHRSMIRHAKDAMRMYNFWQTAITEKIALAPKVPFIGTVEMFAGLEAKWRQANVTKEAFLPYNPDPKAPGMKPERSQPAFVNASEIQQSMQSVEDLKATIGMFDASLGAAGNETSGRAILARQSEGDRATFAWIDNLARGIEHTGRILVDLIPKIYDTQRVARILGEDGSEKMVTLNERSDSFDINTGQFKILNNVGVGKYDVRVSMGPSYQTKRMESAESMMAFVQAFPASAPLISDLIAKAMDWPGSDEIADRLRTMVPAEARKDEMEPEEQEAISAAQEQAQKERALSVSERVAKMQKDVASAGQSRTAALENLANALQIASESGIQLPTQ